VRVRAAAPRRPGGKLALAHATDAEAIHDLRVAARRLTAGLRLWRPALAGRPARRALRLLRRARRRFGPLREIEVHTTELARRTRDLPRVPPVLVRIAVAWRERYERDRRAALERIEPERLRSLRLHLEDAIAALDERVRDPKGRRAADSRQIDAAPGTPGQIVADGTAIELFHRARAVEVALQRERGMLHWHRIAGRGSPSPNSEALGKAHDHATLRQAVAEDRAPRTRLSRNHGPAPGMPWR
jgi:CHAD domain-containing protein